MIRKVCLIIPWFHFEHTGGAEKQAAALARILSDRGLAVEIVTTTSHSQTDFFGAKSPSFYSALSRRENGVLVHRFPTDKRDREKFDRVNRLLLEHGSRIPGVPPISEQEEREFFENGIRSKKLVRFLTRNANHFDAFLFFTYFYPPVILGMDAIHDRSLFIPCLHDESYAYLRYVTDVFLKAKTILFNSEGEYETALRIFGPGIASRSHVAGEGIELTEDMVESVSSEPPMEAPYLLHIGKKDPSKNVPLVIESFLKFKERYGSDAKLVFVGSGSLRDTSSNEDILDMGTVDDARKWKLLKHARALILLSLNESFSRVMYEAFMSAVPVILHEECPATAKAFRQAGEPGWTGKNINDFVEAMHEAHSFSGEILREMGLRGRLYAQRNADWNVVANRYIQLMEGISADENSRSASQKSVRFIQALPTLSFGDAIANMVLSIKQMILEMGYPSLVVAENIDPRMSRECVSYRTFPVQRDDIFIYHHSIGSNITEWVKSHQGKKALIYHNITPPRFFDPYDSALANLLRKGYQELKGLADSFPVSAGVSSFNASELENYGFSDPCVLPLILPSERWNILPDETTARKLNDGRINILFVGRIVPNKKQNDLVEVLFHLQNYVSRPRLILAGGGFPNSKYEGELLRRIERLELQEDVYFTGKTTESVLMSCYQSADIFLSLSEHEGFGAPLIEAMWFDIPVLAYPAGGVPETMRDAPFLLPEHKDPDEIARLAAAVLLEDGIRNGILQYQRVNRERFTPQNLRDDYSLFLNNLIHAPIPSIASDSSTSDPDSEHAPPEDPRKPKVALIVQRAGNEIFGGSEKHCMEIARLMSDDWNTEILTTTARDYMTWSNSYPPGIQNVNGISVRRFSVDHPREIPVFNRLSGELFQKADRVTNRDFERWMNAQGPVSSDLIEYLKQNQYRYDFFIFFTYLYATTYYGLKEVSDRAYLVPTAHDEPPIHMAPWKEWFALPRGFIFNTMEEKLFLEKRFPDLALPGVIAGLGPRKPVSPDGDEFRKIYSIGSPYVLYVGRIDPSKGCDVLLEYFKRYKQENPGDLKLILIGKSEMTIPSHPDILVPGALDDPVKDDAIAGCEFLINPSPYESLSLIILEAWLQQKPTLVNGVSDVMVNQSRRSGGGIWYHDYEEFQAAFEYLIKHPNMARNASPYVRENYHPEVIRRKYLEMVHKK